MKRKKKQIAAMTIALIGALGACSGEPSEQAPEEAAPAVDAAPTPGARSQPGTQMGIYTPEQHALYDGRFVVTGSRVHQVGTLNDASPWDHMGDDASNVREVDGSIEVDVNEIDDTGTFLAELDLPEGRYAVTINPAAFQLDFYIRSPEANEANHPTREVFDHFFAMEVTWR